MAKDKKEKKPKKKFDEEKNLGDGQGQDIDVPSEAVLPESEVTEVTEEKFLAALKELGGKASASAIRKKLGLPVVRQTKEPLHWYAAEVRTQAKQQETKGKIKVVSEKRTQVYQLVDEAPATEEAAVEQPAEA